MINTRATLKGGSRFSQMSEKQETKCMYDPSTYAVIWCGSAITRHAVSRISERIKHRFEKYRCLLFELVSLKPALLSCRTAHSSYKSY